MFDCIRIGRLSGLCSGVVLLCLETVLPGSGWAQTRLSYEVEAVSGQVLVWNEDGASWRTLKLGDEFIEGALAQLTAESSIKGRAIARKGSVGVGNGFLISSAWPVTTRLSPTTVKRVELAGYFLDIDTSFFDQESSAKEDPSEEDAEQTALVRFRRGWERMVSYFNDHEMTVKEGPLKMGSNSSDADSTNAGDDVIRIPLSYPKSGETIIVPSLPTMLAVAWSTPDEAQSQTLFYKVLLWDAASGTPRLIGTTDETYYKLEISKAGNYYVRVESVDGRMKSPSQLFVVSVF